MASSENCRICLLTVFSFSTKVHLILNTWLLPGLRHKMAEKEERSAVVGCLCSSVPFKPSFGCFKTFPCVQHTSRLRISCNKRNEINCMTQQMCRCVCHLHLSGCFKHLWLCVVCYTWAQWAADDSSKWRPFGCRVLRNVSVERVASWVLHIYLDWESAHVCLNYSTFTVYLHWPCRHRTDYVLDPGCRGQSEIPVESFQTFKHGCVWAVRGLP